MKVKIQSFIIEINRAEMSAIAKLIGGTSGDIREKQFGMSRKESDAAHAMYDVLIGILEGGGNE